MINNQVIDHNCNYDVVDVVKLIMALLVVAIHTSPFIQYENTIVDNIYDAIVGMAVPFFFIASGYFLGLKQSRNDATSILSCLKRYVLLYIKWSAIYLPLAVYHYIERGMGLKNSVASYIRGFLFVGENFNSWPLWYLLALCIAILFLYFVIRVLRLRWEIILAISIVIYFFGNTMTYLVYNNDASTILRLYRTCFESGRVLTGIFPVTVGFLIAGNKIRDFHNNALRVIVLPVLMAIRIWNPPVIGLFIGTVMVICIFQICISYQTKIHSECFQHMRNMSTTIYFLHMYVVSFYSLIIMKQTKVLGMRIFLLTALTTLFISIIVELFRSMRVRNKITDTITGQE